MILIVDADWILFNASYVKQDEELKTFEQCCESIDFYIDSLFDETEAESYVLCFTSGGNNFRKVVDPQYKANRVGRDLPLFFNEMKEYIFSKYNCCYGGGYEADDMCASYIKLYPEAILSHVDKDLNQIPSPNHYDSKKKEFYEVSREDGLKQLYLSLVTGDSGDNIKGIPGKGIKFAEKLLTSCLELGVNFLSQILEEYINHFGEAKGIHEFYKNYTCLKLVDNISDFELVLPRKIDNNGD